MDPVSDDRSKGAKVALISLGLLLAIGAICCGGIYLFGQRIVDWIAPHQSGSGVLAEQKRLVEGFDAVRLDVAADVSISIGEAFDVTLRADDNLMPLLETVVEDGVLVLRARERYTSDSGVYFEITLPVLRSVTNAGVGDMTVTGLDAPSFEVVVTGVGDVDASGRAVDLTVTVSGVGDALLADLVAERVTAQTSGVGDIEVHATQSLDATIDGVGDVRYRGEPADIRETKNGVGDVVPIR